MCEDGRQIRVLHMRTVCGTGGGPDKTILKSCEHLNRRGHLAHAFYMMDRANDTGMLEASAKAMGIVMNVAMEDGPVCWETLAELNHLLAVGEYDIVHAHDYKSNVLARLMRAKYRYRIVATAHGYNATTKRELFYYRLEQWMFRFADAVVTPTSGMRNFLSQRGIEPARMHVIRNGIETMGREKMGGHERNRKVKLVYVGRLSEEKDLPNFLGAISLLRGRGIEVEATIAGDGPERERLAWMIEEMRLGGCVTLPGYVTDVMGLLAGADVLVNPSRTECMPNSILEAMWAGVPVVATDVGGVSEMLKDGVEGVLCRAEDSEQLAEAIEKVIGDERYAAALAEKAGQRVMREFTFEGHIKTMVELYRQVLGM
jgi:glycosyltransferase involved in cell wall biosynthesis